jgi:hypothetical protein
VFFVEVLRSCEPSPAAPHNAAPSTGATMQPLPHASLSSLVHLQREMLTAAASHVHACCTDDMPPNVAAVRHVVPLCAQTMPAHSPASPIPFNGLLLLDGSAPSNQYSHASTPARTQMPRAAGEAPTNNLTAPPPRAESVMGHTVAHEGNAGRGSMVEQPSPVASGISGGCFPGIDVRQRCKRRSVSDSDSLRELDLGSSCQWQHPVLQAVLEAVVASVDRCEELLDDIEDTESGMFSCTHTDASFWWFVHCLTCMCPLSGRNFVTSRQISPPVM